MRDAGSDSFNGSLYVFRVLGGMVPVEKVQFCWPRISHHRVQLNHASLVERNGPEAGSIHSGCVMGMIRAYFAALRPWFQRPDSLRRSGFTQQSREASPARLIGIPAELSHNPGKFQLPLTHIWGCTSQKLLERTENWIKLGGNRRLFRTTNVTLYRFSRPTFEASIIK